jgi:hypothetical protein
VAKGKVDAAAATKALDEHDEALLRQTVAFADRDYRSAHDISYDGYQHMFPHRCDADERGRGQPRRRLRSGRGPRASGQQRPGDAVRPSHPPPPLGHAVGRGCRRVHSMRGDGDPAPRGEAPASAAKPSSAGPGAFRSTRTLAPSAEPASLRIARIGVTSGLERLRRRDDGTVAVPRDWQSAGWYADGARPGDAGSR